MKTTGLVAALSWTLVAACTISAPAAAALVNPFGTQSRTNSRGLQSRQAIAPGDCTPVPPIKGLAGVRFYVDTGSTTIDPSKRQASRDAARPLNALASQVTALTRRFLASGRRDGGAAACVVSVLDSWAGASALSGSFNDQGLGSRRWVINAVAVDFLAVKNSPAVDPQASARVAAWLDGQGNAIIATMKGMTNNHLYWAAAAVAATAIAADDRTNFDWAVGAARMGLSEVQADGTLPQEVLRKQLALNYHIFALEPLVQVAGFAAANGVDLYSVNGGALGRLASLVLAGLRSPAPFVKLTGLPQEMDADNADTLSWAEQYYADTGDCAVAPLLSSGRPVRKTYLGGDTTLLYGAKRPLSACGARQR